VTESELSCVEPGFVLEWFRVASGSGGISNSTPDNVAGFRLLGTEVKSSSNLTERETWYRPEFSMRMM
jgi:hypothetical protein